MLGLQQLRVLVNLDHFFDDSVLGAVEVGVISEFTRLISALFSDPLLLARQQVPLELTIVSADDALGGIVETVADIIRALVNRHGSVHLVAEQREAIGTQTLQLLSVETPILDRAVVPFLVLELQVVVEEVLALDELSTVPLGNILTL